MDTGNPLTIEAIKVMSGPEIRKIDDDQFRQSSSQTQEALKDRGKELIDEGVIDLTNAHKEDTDFAPVSLDETSSTGVPSEESEEVEKLESKLIPLTVDGVVSLTDKEVSELTNELIESVADPKVRKLLYEKHRIYLDKIASSKGEGAAKKFFSPSQDNDEYERDDKSSKPKPVESDKDAKDEKDTRDEKEPIKMINDFDVLTANITKELEKLPASTRLTIEEYLKTQNEKLAGGIRLDNKKNKENRAALAVEKRAKLQKDVLRILRFGKWAIYGAGIGFLVSLAPDSVGWGIGAGAGIFAGGSLYEGLISKKGKELALESAKIDTRIEERKQFTTQLRERALRREVKTLSAYTNIAAQIFADSEGTFDDASRKRFISTFVSKSGLSTLNAILAT